MRKYNTGVVVARLHVKNLTEAHSKLINTACDLCDKVVIFLGMCMARDSKKNPLDFHTRKLMLEELYEDIIILPLPDRATDEEWSKELDKRINEVAVGSVQLFVGRDSFISHYTGKFNYTKIPEVEGVSGSLQREKIRACPLSCESFRAGVIYAKANQFDKVHPCVDLAIYRKENEGNEVYILLGQKHGEKTHRLLGGFMDPSDLSAEDAAGREGWEETDRGSVEFGPLEYIASAQIDDWRYRNETNKIITMFFAAPYIFGSPEIIIPEHRSLVFTLLDKKWPV